MKIFGMNITKAVDTLNDAVDIERSYDPILGTLKFNSYSTFTKNKSLKLSVVYRCVNLISNSIAALPMSIYEYRDNWAYPVYDDLYNLLNVKPNAYMNAFTFRFLMTATTLLKGNTYILTKRKGLNVTELIIMDSDDIEVEIEKGGKKYNSKSTGASWDDSEIIHLMNYTNDGLKGISTLEYAANALEIAHNTETHAGNFFKSGAKIFGLLKPVAGVSMSPTQSKDAKKGFKTAVDEDGIVVLDNALDYQPLTVNPKDSQMLESRMFNVLDICRFFNVPPSLAFDQGGKYSTQEQEQLQFLNNTLLPIIEKIETEFFSKLFLKEEWNEYDLKINVDNLLRADKAAQADYYVKMHQIGAYTSNEIRQAIFAPFPLKGGNRGFVAVNLQPVDALISEQKNVSDPSGQIDNKMK